MIRTLVPIVALGALLSGQVQAQTAAQSGARPAPAVKPGGIVNLNTATAAELQGLPGLEWPRRHGLSSTARRTDPSRKLKRFWKIQVHVRIY